MYTHYIDPEFIFENSLYNEILKTNQENLGNAKCRREAVKEKP